MKKWMNWTWGKLEAGKDYKGGVSENGEKRDIKKKKKRALNVSGIIPDVSKDVCF